MKTLKDIEEVETIFSSDAGYSTFDELCVVRCDRLVDLAIEWVEHFQKCSDKNMELCVKMFCEFFNLKERKE